MRMLISADAAIYANLIMFIITRTNFFFASISLSIMDAQFVPKTFFGFAAFGFAPVIRPPPMICHYYRDLCSPGKLTSNPTAPHLLKIGHGSSSSSNLFMSNKADFEPQIGYTSHAPPRIAIIGGGIAGVTAANALSKKFSANNIPANITIFEGDEKGSNNNVNFLNHEHPSWVAGKSAHHALTQMYDFSLFFAYSSVIPSWM